MHGQAMVVQERRELVAEYDFVLETFLTTNEVARLTRTQPQTWRKRRLNGTGPRYSKVGNRCLYKLSDLHAWLEARTFSSTSDEAAQHQRQANAHA
jgi:hypothetical protein